MSMRPPQTPRGPGGTSDNAGSTPGLSHSRRRSALPVRPPSSLSNSSSVNNAAALNSLKEAIRHNDPSNYAASPSHSPTPTSMPKRTPLNAAHHHQQQRRASPAAQPAPKRDADSSEPQIGDAVSFTVATKTMSGVVRFLGPVQGKDGHWAGVQLDQEWKGHGKNDGSVQGIKYFECEPQSGLFLPIHKLVVLERAAAAKPQQPSASQAALARITVGSRASKYVGMTAKDLAQQRKSEAPTATTPSRSVRAPTTATASPKRSTSPEKTASLAASTSSSAGTTFATPRGKPRTSIALPTPSTVKKTPRLSMGGSSSVRRPSSSLRTHTSSAAPEVPPLPPSFARSVTPASQRSAIGRGTPSTPSFMATGHRRPSTAATNSSSVSESRPTTPSVSGRSVSRQSFASSVSRQSGRSSVLGHSTSASVAGGARSAAQDEMLQAALEREKELKMLLEGSEKVGREMEDQLAETKDQLKVSVARLSKLESDQAERSETSTSDAERERLRASKLEREIEEMRVKLESTQERSDKEAQEWQTKLAARESEIEACRDRILRSEEERQELETELSKLRSAGQALCATYEERIAEIENDRIAAVELAEELSIKMAQHDEKLKGEQDQSVLSASTRDAGVAAAEAARIDAETAKAEIDHLQDKVRQLEDQLDEARAKLEAEIEESNKRTTKSSEVEAKLKKDIAGLKDALDSASKSEALAQQRIVELENALRESQAQLERERAELETLRNEANASASSAVADDLARANKQLASLRTQHSQISKEAEDARKSAADSAALVEELQASLKLTEADLQEERQRAKDMSASDNAAELQEQISDLRAQVDRLGAEKDALQNKHREATERLAQTSKPSEGDDQLRTEVSELRAQLKEAIDTAAREKETFNQDIADLEALIESKLYREEELEDELEKYKTLVAASTKTKTNGHATTGPASTEQASSSLKDSHVGDVSQDECEMCGKLGHDLDSCPEFGGTAASSSSAPKSKSVERKDGQEYCDDCEEYGHSLADCPLADEMF